MEKPIEYDKSRRMKYNPEYHFNQGNPYTQSDLVYICKNYSRGNLKDISMATGRTEGTLASKVYLLKKNGFFDKFRQMDVDED